MMMLEQRFQAQDGPISLADFARSSNRRLYAIATPAAGTARLQVLLFESLCSSFWELLVSWKSLRKPGH